MTDQPRRFIPLAQMCATLHINRGQGYSLIHTGQIPAIQIGGRGIWRVEVSELEAFIQRQYAATRAKIADGDPPVDVNGE